MWLLVMATVGFVVGNGTFVYWLLHEYRGLDAILDDHLALSFILDALLTLIVLSVVFARQPGNRVRWPWFVVLSLLGGLCFGLPFYWWLNQRGASSPAVSRA